MIFTMAIVTAAVIAKHKTSAAALLFTKCPIEF